MIHEQVVAAQQVVSALDGVTVSYIVDEAEARQRLGDMVSAGGPVAIDIETAPHAAHVEKLASLIKDREVARGKLRALKKLKAPADEIAALVAEGKQLAAAIKYAKTAGLDPRRARIRLLQVYDGGDRVLVIDLDRTGAGVLEPARRRERHRPQHGLRAGLHRDGWRRSRSTPLHGAGLQVDAGRTRHQPR